MEDENICPKCAGVYVYEDGNMLVCPECAHTWGKLAGEDEGEIRDAFGNVLTDGDSVTVVKDLKLKGGGGTIKQGTKIKNIRLNHSSDHNIDCKIDGFGAMGLKSEFLKKA